MKMETKIVRKISMKVLGVQEAAKNVRKTEKPVALARIWGIARGVKGVTTDLGLANALIGSFEAVSLIDTAQAFAAPKLFLPAGADEIIVASLGQDGSTGVQFALEFGAEPDSKGALGYRYTVRSLIKPVENDTLAALRSQANPQAIESASEAKQIEAPSAPPQLHEQKGHDPKAMPKKK